MRSEIHLWPAGGDQLEGGCQVVKVPLVAEKRPSLPIACVEAGDARHLETAGPVRVTTDQAGETRVRRDTLVPAIAVRRLDFLLAGDVTIQCPEAVLPRGVISHLGRESIRHPHKVIR